MNKDTWICIGFLLLGFAMASVDILIECFIDLLKKLKVFYFIGKCFKSIYCLFCDILIGIFFILTVLIPLIYFFIKLLIRKTK